MYGDQSERAQWMLAGVVCRDIFLVQHESIKRPIGQVGTGHHERSEYAVFVWHHYMGRERPGDTLQTTALVNEA